MLALTTVLLCGGCNNSEQLQLVSGDSKVSSDEALSVKDDKSAQKSSADDKENITSKDKIYIYVCGAVKNSGVYELDFGARAADAVEAAGGILSEADVEKINLAAVIDDGQQLRVPFKGEVTEQTSLNFDAQKSNSSDKVNINKASKEELMTLTGIGESKADSIISYRENNEGFSSIEDLMKIEGIKEGVFNKIKDRICVK